MKKLLILIFILVAPVLHAQTYWADTLESGSSDSIKTIGINEPAKFVMIAFKQLDTNATSPDTVTLFNGTQTIIQPVDFNLSVGDSLKSVITFTYASSTGQQRIGWVWLPNMTSLYIRMANAQYLTNRKVLCEVTITY